MLERRLVTLGYYPVSLENYYDKLIAHGVLEGRLRSLVVDTGWGWSTMAEPLGRAWPSPAERGVALVDPVFGVLTNLASAKGKLALLPALYLSGVVFSNQPVIVQKLDSLPFQQDGVLGVDFLLRNYAILDCAGRRLYIRDRPPPPETRAVIIKSLALSRFRAVDLKLRRGLGVTCGATLNGQPITLLLDSGSAFTMLDRHSAKAANVAWSSKTRSAVQGFRGRHTKVYEVSRVSLALGDWPVTVPAMKCGDLSAWNLGPKAKNPALADGLIGMSELTREGAFIDFGAGKLWLKPDPVSYLRAETGTGAAPSQ